MRSKVLSRTAHRRATRPRLLLVGAGDVAQRLQKLVPTGWRVFALTRRAESASTWRTLGVCPVLGDLDQPASLRRLAGLATHVLHAAPPPSDGISDSRTRRLLAAFAGKGGIVPQRLVYISTSGVYGDCAGAWVAESRPVAPQSGRAKRRVAAEQILRRWGHKGRRMSILRAPGIYAADRLPRERIARGEPSIQADEDAYSNHIHADDLASTAWLALFRGRANRVYHVVDDSQQKIGDYFDAIADHFGLPRPPRLVRAAVQQAVSPAIWSFLAESRRLYNRRLKRELRVRLRYPTVMDGLLAANPK